MALTITSFTTIFKRIMNFVNVRSHDIYKNVSLNEKQIHYRYNTANDSDVKYVSLWLVLSTFFGVLIYRIKDSD